MRRCWRWLAVCVLFVAVIPVVDLRLLDMSVAGGATSFLAPLFAAEPPPVPDTPHAGTREDPCVLWNSLTLGLVWDNSWADRQIARADAEVYTEDATLQETLSFVGEALFPRDTPTHKMGIFQKVATHPNGLYYCRVRVWDTNGNVSGWSSDLWYRKDWVQLQPPGGCRIVQ